MAKLLLHLCRECLKDDAAAASLRTAVEREFSGQAAVTLSPCLEQCETPVAMALHSAGGAGYVFSGIDAEADRADIVATCRAYLDSPDGWIEDARPCGRLRFCLAARLPA